MNTLGIILARAGSKGLKDKCVRPLLGKPLIEYTFAHAASARLLTDFLLTTDSEPAKTLARQQGIKVVDRPAELANDTATVDAAARHAVLEWERESGRPADVVVLLYGNIPIRSDDLIDRAIEHLARSGADSVRSVAPVSKQHPDWIHRLEGDCMQQFRPNSIYRRQDLEPLYYHDGAVAVVTRKALFGAMRTPEDHQSFLGKDRRAIVQRCDDAVDVDEAIDLHVAEAVLRANGRAVSDGSKELVDGTVVRPVVVGTHPIGPGGRILLIAEAGVNHNGSVDLALQMVEAAAAAGADAVKFQMFRADDLVTANGKLADYQSPHATAKTQREMLRTLELGIDAFRQIKKRCDERGVLFLVTPFGEAEIAELCELEVAAIKIASTDLTNRRLLGAAGKTGLPLIVSTGAATQDEIRIAVDGLRAGDAADRLILLHCISCYPTPLDALNLRAIGTLYDAFRVPIGFSDHSTALEAGALAVASGAFVIEKHFTLDRTMPGPDHAMSLEPESLRQYFARARDAERAMGAFAFGLLPIEADVRRAARRSVVAAANIDPGTVLTDELLTLKRPGDGLSPQELPGLVGRRALVNIPSDTPLSWDMVR